MLTRILSLIGKVAAVLAPSLLVVGLFATLAAAAPAPPAAPNVTLQGGNGITNNLTGQTKFVTASGTSAGGFVFTDTTNNATAMRVFCPNGNGCTGISATAVQFGIRGNATAAGGISRGVDGNTSGAGPSAVGVAGEATNAAAGNVAAGVRGRAQSPDGTGVWGLGGHFGVRGFPEPDSAAAYGGYFTATAGVGLYGGSSSKFGVFGESSTSIAVLGISSKNIGVEAKSDQSTGLVAVTNHGTIALRASNNSGKAGSFAGIFDGDVQINGNLTCSPACVAAMGVSTDKGERLVYADAGAQSKIYDEGTATLKDGRAVVKIDALFAQTVNLGAGYQVFVTPTSDDTYGLAVLNQTASSFEVHDLKGGKGNFAFHWRISALRKGHEGVRLGPAPIAPAADPAE